MDTNRHTALELANRLIWDDEPGLRVAAATTLRALVAERDGQTPAQTVAPDRARIAELVKALWDVDSHSFTQKRLVFSAVEDAMLALLAELDEALKGSVDNSSTKAPAQTTDAQG